MHTHTFTWTHTHTHAHMTNTHTHTHTHLHTHPHSKGTSASQLQSAKITIKSPNWWLFDTQLTHNQTDTYQSGRVCWRTWGLWWWRQHSLLPAQCTAAGWSALKCQGTLCINFTSDSSLYKHIFYHLYPIEQHPTILINVSAADTSTTP